MPGWLVQLNGLRFRGLIDQCTVRANRVGVDLTTFDRHFLLKHPLEEFTTVPGPRVIITHWRQNYNHRWPNSSLAGLTLAAFASRRTALTPFAALPTFKRHSESEPITQTISS